MVAELFTNSSPLCQIYSQNQNKLLLNLSRLPVSITAEVLGSKSEGKKLNSFTSKIQGGGLNDNEIVWWQVMGSKGAKNASKGLHYGLRFFVKEHLDFFQLSKCDIIPFSYCYRQATIRELISYEIKFGRRMLLQKEAGPTVLYVMPSILTCQQNGVKVRLECKSPCITGNHHDTQ